MNARPQWDRVICRSTPGWLTRTGVGGAAGSWLDQIPQVPVQITLDQLEAEDIRVVSDRFVVIPNHQRGKADALGHARASMFLSLLSKEPFVM
jgi:hypothetical protein